MLYIISTPIGNLGDISLRAIDTLEKVDYLLCEDTRKTGLLLQNLQIKNKPKLISFYDEVEDQKIPEIINLLKDNNTTVVLFEDANNTGYKDNEVFKKLASNLNVVMIESKSDHTLVPTDAFYENVLGFINGDASILNSFSGKY